jgi:hypothetical protein
MVISEDDSCRANREQRDLIRAEQKIKNSNRGKIRKLGEKKVKKMELGHY